MRGKDTRVPGVECEYGAVVGHQQAACADRLGVAPERGEIRVIGGYAGCAEHCRARGGDRQRGRLFGQAAGIGERAAAHGVQVAARVARIRAGGNRHGTAARRNGDQVARRKGERMLCIAAAVDKVQAVVAEHGSGTAFQIAKLDAERIGKHRVRVQVAA